MPPQGPEDWSVRHRPPPSWGKGQGPAPKTIAQRVREWIAPVGIDPVARMQTDRILDALNPKKGSTRKVYPINLVMGPTANQAIGIIPPMPGFQHVVEGVVFGSDSANPIRLRIWETSVPGDALRFQILAGPPVRASQTISSPDDLLARLIFEKTTPVNTGTAESTDAVTFSPGISARPGYGLMFSAWVVPNVAANAKFVISGHSYSADEPVTLPNQG